MGDSGEACAASVSAQPFEAAFHPSAPLLVASLITGHLEVRRPPPPPLGRALVFPQRARVLDAAVGSVLLLSTLHKETACVRVAPSVRVARTTGCGTPADAAVWRHAHATAGVRVHVGCDAQGPLVPGAPGLMPHGEVRWRRQHAAQWLRRLLHPRHGQHHGPGAHTHVPHPPALLPVGQLSCWPPTPSCLGGRRVLAVSAPWDWRARSQMVARLENAHGAGVNTITTLNETNIASGECVRRVLRPEWQAIRLPYLPCYTHGEGGGKGAAFRAGLGS
jgi:hypothetical protein